MALIKCPECGKEISDPAKICIWCGAALQEPPEETTDSPAADSSNPPAEEPEFQTEEPQETPKAQTNSHRNRMLAVIAVLIVAGVGIFFAVRALTQPDYYREGLEVAKTMGELLKSDEYARLMTSSTGIITIAKEYFDTGDYDSPVAVYSLRIKDREKYIKSFFRKEEEKERWKNLTPSLREQAYEYCSITNLVTKIYSAYSDELISICGLFQTEHTSERLNGDGTLAYLYVFKKGMPIVVDFRDHNATGSFLLNKDELGSLSAVRAVFEPYGFEVTQVRH